MRKTEYSPPPRPFLPATLSFLLLLLSSAVSFISTRTDLKFPLTVIAMFLALMCFQVFFRYCLTRYCYTLENGIFRVVRKTGKYENVIFDLTLRSAIGITDIKKKKRIAEHFELSKDIRFISMTQDLFCRKKYCLAYDCPSTVCVFLQINGEMAEEIQSYINLYNA